MRYTKEQLDKQYQQLSPQIREVLGSSSVVDALINIGKKYNLHMDQLDRLSEEFSLTLYGLEKPTNFSSNLTKYLGISEDIANLIVYDVNQQIFSKIRQEMQKTYAPEQSPEKIIEQKLNSITNVPKQEVEVKPQTGDNKVASGGVTPARDPYHEPV